MYEPMDGADQPSAPYPLSPLPARPMRARPRANIPVESLAQDWRLRCRERFDRLEMGRGMMPHPGWAFPPPFGRGMPMPGMFGAPPFGHHPFGPFVMDPRYRTSSASSVPKPPIRPCRVTLRRPWCCAVRDMAARRACGERKAWDGVSPTAGPACLAPTAARSPARSRTSRCRCSRRATASDRPACRRRRGGSPRFVSHCGAHADLRRKSTAPTVRRASGPPMLLLPRLLLTARPMLFSSRMHAAG